MPDSRLNNGEEIDEEEDEEVSDNPLPAWLEGDSLAPPCQADMDVVRAIIDFAGVTEDDVLYDLGCGDGRICIEAAESRGAKACGVEIEENLADKFRRRVAAKGLESKVSVVHGDLRDVDLSDATVLVMYLLPEAMGDIAQSHLLPFLRRGRCTPPSREATTLAGDEETQHHCDASSAVLPEGGVDEGEGGSVEGRGRPGSARCDKPFRIVCNTWGIPGATAVREAGVGMYGGVKLRLFTHESLPVDATM